MRSYIWKNLANCQRKVIMHSVWFNCGFLSFLSFFVISRRRVLPVWHLSPKLLLLIRYVTGIFPGQVTPDHKVALMWRTLHVSGHQDHLVRHRRKLPNPASSSFRSLARSPSALHISVQLSSSPSRPTKRFVWIFFFIQHTFIFSPTYIFIPYVQTHSHRCAYAHTYVSIYLKYSQVNSPH